MAFNLSGPAALRAPVGIGALNDPPDVTVVQTLLNAAGGGTTVDGKCGRMTVAAICNFQRSYMSQADGLITPGGGTFTKLAGGTLRIVNPWRLLPSDPSYHTYCAPKEDIRDRQWGTQKTIATIQRVCRGFYLTHLIKASLGDISLVQGGLMHPHHKGHRIGKNIDIRPIRTDRANVRVDISQTRDYDREATLHLAQALAADPNVSTILFNCAYVKEHASKVRPFDGHDDHLHVQMHE